MAAPSKTDPRVEIGLEELRTVLGDLREVSVEWDAMSDGERASWSADWDQLMTTYLPLLDRHARANRMPEEQLDRYREVLRALREALPTIERLDLCRPSVPLEP
jgi:hypothetical protein